MKLVILGEGDDSSLRLNVSGITEDVKDPKIRELAVQLEQLCRARGGAGLAATQAGLAHNFFFMDPRSWRPDIPGGAPKGWHFFNPSWEPVGREKALMPEGCLSLPGRSFVVERPKKIKAKWTNDKGVILTRVLHGFTARCFMHETDHLRGKLICDPDDS